MLTLHDDFTPSPSRYWKHFLSGGGVHELTGHSLRLVKPGTSARRYTTAQIDDYQDVPRRDFRWRPPLTLTVRARFSHPGTPPFEGDARLQGTAGFGFWNDPFLMTG